MSICYTEQQPSDLVISINMTKGGETMDVGTSEFWKMFGVALMSGSIIGLERQIRGKPAGIRTCVLICLGTALFDRLARVCLVHMQIPRVYLVRL
ncbi:MgtC/SapB family protein [Chloroflexota bacterium]